MGLVQIRDVVGLGNIIGLSRMHIFMIHLPVLNYQGGDLSSSVSSARTSELSSIQGDLGKSGKRYHIASLTIMNDNLSKS